MSASLLSKIKTAWKNPNVCLDEMAAEYGLSKYKLRQYAKAWGWGRKAHPALGGKKEKSVSRICKPGGCIDWEACRALPASEPVMCENFFFFFEGESVDREPVYTLAIPMNIPLRLEVE